MSTLPDEERVATERRYVLVLAALATLIAAIPSVYALISTPPGGVYLGYEFNTDDQMVYSAWIRQAMDGRLLMDNRFTPDPQPGLTVNLYFFLVGQLARFVGIPLAANLARLALTFAFVPLAYWLIRRWEPDTYRTKLGLALAVFGGGVGFLVWHSFGQAIVRPTPAPLREFLLGRLPTDVWQPEGFVLPSALTNGLFMAALALILIVFDRLLAARESGRAVFGGAIAMALLMNVHSYDVLLVFLVAVGLGVAMAVRKEASAIWALRALLIGLGAVPPALWFLYVLANDPVFRARAATETFAPNFRQLLFGYLPMVLLGLGGLAYRAHHAGGERGRRIAGIALAGGLYLALFVAAAGHAGGAFLGLPAWLLAFSVALGAVALLAEERPIMNLLIAWAVLGLVIPYFPALFQRKLAMGLAVPWAMLAAHGVAAMLRKQERSSRNLATILVLLLLGGSSALWVTRAMGVYIAGDVASTTRHRVFMAPDMRRIVQFLDARPGRKVVLALPGASNPKIDPNTGRAIPDEFLSPALPDVAPIATGLTGAYTYAGHWSETPDYLTRAGVMSRFFLAAPFGGVRRVMTDSERAAFARSVGANFAIVPVRESYPGLPLVEARRLGRVVVPGAQFALVELALGPSRE